MAKQKENQEPTQGEAEIKDPLAPTMNDNEGLPILKSKREFRTVITGADFKEFELGEVFEGEYQGEPVIRKKDGADVANNPNHKAGTIMGYAFKDEQGNDVIIGNSQQIKEVMDASKKGDWVRFTFLGKFPVPTRPGQSYNKFKIEVAS